MHIKKEKGWFKQALVISVASQCLHCGNHKECAHKCKLLWSY